MKTLLSLALATIVVFLSGCETTVVDRRPVTVRGNGYDRDYNRRGYPGYRDVRVVETHHDYRDRDYDRNDRIIRTNTYDHRRPAAVVVRPAPVVRRTVVVTDNSHSRKYDDRREKKKKHHDDDDNDDDEHDH